MSQPQGHKPGTLTRAQFTCHARFVADSVIDFDHLSTQKPPANAKLRDVDPDGRQGINSLEFDKQHFVLCHNVLEQTVDKIDTIPDNINIDCEKEEEDVRLDILNSSGTIVKTLFGSGT